MIVLGGVTGLVAFVGCMALFAFSFIDFDRQHLLELTPRTIILTGACVIGLIAIVVLLSLNLSDVTALPRGIFRLVGKLQSGNAAAASNIVPKGGRLYLWMAAVAVWSLHPLFGGGLGSWSLLGGMPDLAGDYAHNIILEILGELGIFGLILFVVPIAVLVRNIVLNWRNIPPGVRDILAYFSLFCVIHAFVIGNLAAYWTFAGLGALFFGTLYRGEPPEKIHQQLP
jgi:O-antigen ligase